MAQQYGSMELLKTNYLPTEYHVPTTITGGCRAFCCLADAYLCESYQWYGVLRDLDRGPAAVMAQPVSISI